MYKVLVQKQKSDRDEGSSNDNCIVASNSSIYK